MGETGGQRLAEAHRTVSRPLTGADAHLLGQEPLDTGTPESLPPSFVIVSFGAFPHRARTFRKLTYCQIPPPPQEQNPSAATRRRAVRPSSFLSFPAARCCSLSPCPCKSRAVRRLQPAHLGGSMISPLEGEASEMRCDALFRRGGMCNAPECKGSASGVLGSGGGG